MWHQLCFTIGKYLFSLPWSGHSANHSCLRLYILNSHSNLEGLDILDQKVSTPSCLSFAWYKVHHQVLEYLWPFYYFQFEALPLYGRRCSRYSLHRRWVSQDLICWKSESKKFLPCFTTHTHLCLFWKLSRSASHFYTIHRIQGIHIHLLSFFWFSSLIYRTHWNLRGTSMKRNQTKK